MTFNSARSPIKRSPLAQSSMAPCQQQLGQQLGQQLKQPWQDKTASTQGWAAPLQRWAMAALNAGMARSEPRISKRMTARGPQWRVYDPWCDRTHCFNQESEVRVWLEQRYYQN